MVGKGAAHCDSGCTLGDISSEFLALAAPVVATWVFGHVRLDLVVSDVTMADSERQHEYLTAHFECSTATTCQPGQQR